MKTFKEWLKTDKNFRDFVHPGEAVDERMVDHFRDILPPKNMSFGYLQVGEPIKQVLDENGKYRTVYMTFEQELGNWLYKGLCFPGETEDRSKQKGAPWEE